MVYFIKCKLGRWLGLDVAANMGNSFRSSIRHWDDRKEG